MLKRVRRGQLDDHEQAGLITPTIFGWNRLGLHPSETWSVLVNREMWLLYLEVLPPQLSR